VSGQKLVITQQATDNKISVAMGAECTVPTGLSHHL